MKLRVLGCWGDLSDRHRTVGFLFDDRVLVDAGTVVTALPLAQQLRITDVVISHAHLDHVKELPFLIGNRLGEAAGPLVVHAAPRVLSALRAHLFNDRIWPDFSLLPSKASPGFVYERLAPQRTARIGGLSVTPVPVHHTVPCTGLILAGGDRAVLYTSDTGPTEAIWRAGRRHGVRAVLVEVSFPDDMAALARASGHLTPAMLAEELEKLAIPGIPLYVYHLKPAFEDRIRRGLLRFKNPVIFLKQGRTYEL